MVRLVVVKIIADIITDHLHCKGTKSKYFHEKYQLYIVLICESWRNIQMKLET